MTTEKEEETKTMTDDAKEGDDEIYVDPKTGKRYKKRKEMPSVAYLLAHGNPETAHLPPSAMQTYGYPIILALLFAISLLIFHHAPHDKSTHPGFQLPQQQQQKIKNENPEMAELIKRNQEMIEEQRRQEKLQKQQMEKERKRQQMERELMIKQQEQEAQQQQAQEEEEDGQPEEQEPHQPEQEQEQESHQPDGQEQEPNTEL